MRKRASRLKVSVDAEFREQTAYKLGVLEGKVDAVLQRLDSLAESYKAINHNTTQITGRLDRLEQKATDSRNLRTRLIEVGGVIATAVGILLTYLSLIHAF